MYILIDKMSTIEMNLQILSIPIAVHTKDKFISKLLSHILVCLNTFKVQNGGAGNICSFYMYLLDK